MRSFLGGLILILLVVKLSAGELYFHFIEILRPFLRNRRDAILLTGPTRESWPVSFIEDIPSRIEPSRNSRVLMGSTHRGSSGSLNSNRWVGMPGGPHIKYGFEMPVETARATESINQEVEEVIKRIQRLNALNTAVSNLNQFPTGCQSCLDLVRALPHLMTLPELIKPGAPLYRELSWLGDGIEAIKGVADDKWPDLKYLTYPEQITIVRKHKWYKWFKF